VIEFSGAYFDFVFGLMVLNAVLPVSGDAGLAVIVRALVAGRPG